VPRNDLDAFKRSVREGRTSRRVIRKGEGGKGGGLPVKGGPGAANRCLALLSKMFNLAKQWGWRQGMAEEKRFSMKASNLTESQIAFVGGAPPNLALCRGRASPAAKSTALKDMRLSPGHGRGAAKGCSKVPRGRIKEAVPWSTSTSAGVG
jgi:hypothetical protein